jgi:hypothetical protein
MVGFDAELNEIWLKYYFKSLPQAWAQVEGMGIGTSRGSRHGYGHAQIKA